MKLVVMMFALLALVAPARADDTAQAERYFRIGEKAYRAQNFEAAAASFEQAYKLIALPEIAFSAAQAYRRQFQIDRKAAGVARAIQLYRAYLDKVRTGGRVADAADALAELQRELDQLIKSGAKVSAELAAEHTQVGVNVTLEGQDDARGGMREIEDAPNRATAKTKITVTLDGQPILPFTPVNVAPGKHAIHVEADGYAPADRQDNIAQGDFHMIDQVLKPLPAHLRITTEPDSKVAIDGRLAGPVPLAIDVDAGAHLVAVLRDGREAWTRELSLGRGETKVLTPTLEVTAKRRWTSRTVIAASIAGALALGAGTFALIEDSRASELHTQFMTTGNGSPEDAASYTSALTWRNRAIDATWVLGAVAVAAGVTSVVLYYTDKPSIAVTGHF